MSSFIIQHQDEVISSGEIPDTNIEQAVKYAEYERLCLSAALYSAGEDIPRCKEYFMKSLNELSGRNYRLESYVDAVWYVSLCVLYDLGEDAFSKLHRIVPENFYSDMIIAFLMSHLGKTDIRGTEYIMREPYRHLDGLFGNGNKSPSEVLRTYLTEHWYKGHNEEAWYDSHKSGELYFGYWSFEAGAIAKVLGLDDSDLKDSHYYPYDLVHY